MTKAKKPFVITGPGVYITNGKYLVEIIGRAWRLFTTPPNDKKSVEPWIGVKQDQFRTIVHYQGDGEPTGGDNFISQGKLVKRLIEHDTPRERQEAASRAAEEQEQKYLVSETGLRDNIVGSLEDRLADYEVRYKEARNLFKLPFSEWKKSGYGEISQIGKLQHIIGMVLNDLDDIYDFVLNPEANDINSNPEDVGEYMTLLRRPGRKGGLPKMANMEDLAIYVADRLDITLKGKQWIEPTIKLPAKSVATVTQGETKAILKDVAKKLDADGKIPAKLKKPAKIPTVKMEAGAYYKDGKGKIHGPMDQLKKSERIELEDPKFTWVGALRNANGVPCSKLGSGKYFNARGRALDEGKDGINHLIERVTPNGDKYEKPEVDDSYLD